jgi:hypothetical protein
MTNQGEVITLWARKGALGDPPNAPINSDESAD